MPSYIATRQTFVDGILIEVGQSITADSDPGAPFVLASSYAAAETTPVAVASPSGFVVRNGDDLIPQATATRLSGRSDHEPSF